MNPYEVLYSKNATSFYGQSMSRGPNPQSTGTNQPHFQRTSTFQYGAPLPQQSVHPLPNYNQVSLPTSSQLYRQQTMPQSQRPITERYQQQMQIYPPQKNNGFKLLGRGIGIDEREYNCITSSAEQALARRCDPLSDEVILLIKKNIGGEWFVFASREGLKGYDFSLSVVTGNDFLSFVTNGFHFQICRLRD